MRLKTLIAVALVAAVSALPSAYAGPADIFISFSAGGAGTAADNSAEFALGDTGSAYVWVNAGVDIDTGAFLDILNSNTSVVEFTGSEVFNADITVGPTPIDQRWQSVGGGTVTAGLIDEANGFTVNDGTGIVSANTGPTFMDSLFDADANAFLFSRFDFTIVGEGDATFSLAQGDGFIVNAGTQLFPSFGSASLTSVPEPTSAALIAVAMVGLVARRRR